MVLYLGLDDTDSRLKMCTTYVASEIVAQVRGLDLIGLPRLVRLNPNIPWKTRGNGALCLRFGHGVGAAFRVGEGRGRPLWAYPRSSPLEFDEGLWSAAVEAVERLADWEAEDTQPGLLVTQTRPPPRLYRKAVREVVTVEEVAPYLDQADRYTAPRGLRGLIGASAAIAWRPRDRTFEALAYRHPDRWGTKRRVREGDVRRLDARFPTTFNNYDVEEGHMAVAPHSPCPVLVGIRGEVAADLSPALASVRMELAERWLLFETNQGTDEHLMRQRADRLRPHTSAVVEGAVTATPQTIPGGHVVVPLKAGGRTECVAYEPTKSFRHVVRQLRSGDQVRVCGSVRTEPLSINLEKLEVQRLTAVREKRANPQCSTCGRRMKSTGFRAGYRCRPCGTRAPEEAAEFAAPARNLTPGWYEPPVSARRHLSKPLSRMASANA